MKLTTNQWIAIGVIGAILVGGTIIILVNNKNKDKDITVTDDGTLDEKLGNEMETRPGAFKDNGKKEPAGGATQNAGQNPGAVTTPTKVAANATAAGKKQ